MNADENALNDHFLVGMGLMLDGNTDNPNPPFVLLADNQAEETVDASQLYCAWRIEPGDQTQAQTDGTMLALGVATFQIVAPLGSLDRADDARNLRDQFLALFKNWRSGDGCLWIRKLGAATPPSKTDYRIVARIYYQSLR